MYEAKELGKGENCIHNDFGKERIENLCRLANYSYCLTKEELSKIFEEAVKEDLNKLDPDSDSSSFETYFKELVERGFLINVDPHGNAECYRSIHFDILIRASDLRINPFSRKMVSTTRFSVTIQRFSDLADRRYIPRGDGDQIEAQVFNMLNELLGKEYAQIYVNVLSKYFNIKGSRGFNPYQMMTLAKILKEWNRDTFVITATTGLGKTEIFLAIVLIKILHDLKQGFTPIIYVVYPRKMLEVDQMERIILIVELLNEELAKLHKKHKKITVYLRDGDTQQIEKLYEKSDNGVPIPFRGIKCYLGQGSGELFVIKTFAKPKVVCIDKTSNQQKEYDFVIPFRSIPGIDYQDINIVVTNLSTLLYRIVDVNDKDVDARHVLKTSVIILDEVHEYNGILLAYIHFMIKTIKSFRKAKIRDELEFPPPENLKIILVSATLGNHIEFAQKISGSDNVVDLSYSAIEKDVKDLLTGERAIINAYILIHPYASWQTYISELVSFLDYLYYHHKAKYSNKSVALLPQTIVFINNIRELHRTKSVIENALRLGSPLDNLCLRKFQKSCEDLDPIHDRNILRHYVLDSIKYKESLYDSLSSLNAIIYSGTPLEDREKIGSQLKEGEIACVLATSSLELGVDYPGVSIVINLGFDNISSIIQRFGRGGRDVSTLNTVLGIVVARNNPIDYKNFFNNDLILKISNHSLGEEYVIPIPTELYTIKYLAALRAVLTYYALKEGVSPLRSIKNVELAEHFSNLYKLLQDAEELILEIIDKDAYTSLLNELKKLINIDIKTLQEVEEFLEDTQLRLEQYYNSIASIMKLLEENVGSAINDLQRILIERLNASSEIIEKLSQLIYLTDVKLLEGIENLRKDIAASIAELCLYEGKEDLANSLYRIVNDALKNRNDVVVIMNRITGHLTTLQSICQELSKLLTM